MRFVNRNEQATLRKRVRLAAGSHTFALRFEGKVGGCNSDTTRRRAYSASLAVGSVGLWGLTEAFGRGDLGSI